MGRVWCMCAVAGTSRTWKKNMALTEGFSKIRGAPCPLLEQQEAEQSDKTACPRVTTKAWAETITGYGNFQLLPQNHFVLLHTFDFLSPAPGGHHPHLSLPCNELICPNRTGHMRPWRVNMEQELEEWLQKELSLISWEAKLLWKSRNGGLGDTWLLPGGQDWSQKVSPCPLGAALTSCIDLLHYCFLDLKWNNLLLESEMRELSELGLVS